MKKNLFILTMLLCIAVIPEAFAYNFQSGGIYYDITGTSPNTVAVTYATGSYNSYSGNVDIPSTVTYNGTTYTVTAVGNNAFRNCSNLTGVTIPGTVTSIGDYAFYYCGNLHEVDLPDVLTSIGSYAFSQSGIHSVTIPVAVTNIGSFAFYNCGLSIMVFNAENCLSMSGVFGNDFAKNYTVHTITIGNNVNKIPSGAFAHCTHLKSVFIPSSVISIGNNPFADCPGLDTIIVATGNPTYTSGSQNNTIINTVSHILVTGLKNTVIPNHVTTIGGMAFSGCADLMGELIIPEQITVIGASAFYNCTGITSLIIGNLVDSIGNSAFRGCGSLSAVAFNADSCKYMGNSSSSSPVFYSCDNLSSLLIGNNVKSIPANAFYGCSHLTGMLIIPNSVKIIGENAFRDCNGLTSLSIGNSVKSIGNSAFGGCTGMEGTLSIPASVQSIESSAFGTRNSTIIPACTGFTSIVFNADSCITGSFTACSNVSSLIIGNNVKVIPQNAFKDLSHISGSLVIPNSVQTIGSVAFSGCSGLTTLTIGDAVQTIGQSAFGGCSGLTTLTIGNNVKTIGYNAFQNCTGLTSVFFNADSCTNMTTYSSYFVFTGCTHPATLSIGNNVKWIPNNAFRGLNITGALVIPDNVITIGQNAFLGCQGITSIAIPDNVIAIGQNAFQGCQGITSLTIGKKVQTMGNSAFKNCTGLASVVFNADSCISMGDYSNPVFSGCTTAATLTIGENVKTIPEYAFAGFSGLNGMLNIPDSVVSIGIRAFQNCSEIDTLIIGKYVKSIGYGAFENCSGLSSVTYNADSCSMGSYLSYNNKYYYVFSGCSNPSTLTIGNNVRYISENSFRDFTGLTGNVTFPTGMNSIGDNAFYGCSGLASVSMPNSLNNIGTRAFYNCSGLTSVNMNEGLESVGESAFSGCSGLILINLPNSLKSIGESAFYGCSGLTSVTIPDSVTVINDKTFYGCSGLDSFTIGDAVLNIGQWAFAACSGLQTLTIGRSVRTISTRAFGGCSNLSSVYYYADSCTNMGNYDNPSFAGSGNNTTLTIGKNVKYIPSYAFYGFTGLSHVVYNADSCIMGNYYYGMFGNCSNLTSLTIGENVKYIPSYVFNNCTSLAGTITIPDSVNTVGTYAFSNCGMDTLIIGKSVSAINYAAFAGCSSLKHVSFNPDSCGGSYQLFNNCNQLSSLSIGENVRAIPASAFSGCDSLVGTLVLPNSVMYVGDLAFQNCSGYDSLLFGSSLMEIGQYAFSGWSGLHGTLVIPNTVTTIGNYAFEGCSGIDTLNIGQSVNVIDDYAFANCSRLSTVLFNADSCTDMGYWARWANNCDSITSVVIGENVKNIPDAAFYGLQGLRGVLTIPNSVINIGGRAFSNCTGIDTVIIGKSVSTIVDEAFAFCSNLKAVVFNADSCAVCGTGAFGNTTVFPSCDSLSSLIFGDNVKNIPDYAFYGCDKLSGALMLPDSIQNIGASAFRYCSSLTGELVIPDVVSTIGEYAFQNCSGLTGTLVIDGGINAIKIGTFSGCSGIDTIIIGKDVLSIGTNAFQNCTGILSITSYNENPSYNNPFVNVDRNTPVYVPCGSAQAYRDAWRYSTYSSSSYFYNIYETLIPYIFTVTSEDTLKGTVQITTQPTCTESSVIEATPNFFYVFDRWNDGNTDNPRTIELTQDTTLVAYFREYTITLASSDSSVGIATTVVTPTVDNPQAIVEAVVMDSCYVFAGWSDGSMENPHTISLTQDTALTASFNLVINVQISAPTAICMEDSVTLVATGADSYLWFNGDTTSVISLLPENSLEVSVTGTNSNGCSTSATHFVNVLQRPELVISGMTDICEGSSTILTATSATSANPTEELVLFEDFENGLDNWYTWDRDGDGSNWYSTLGNDYQSGYESNGAAASASWNNIALSPDNMLYKPVHIPNTGAQLSWYAAAQDPNRPAEHYDVNIFIFYDSYWGYHSIFSETLSDGQWVHRTLDLSEWAGLDVMIGFEHHNCSDQYALKIDNVRIVTFLEDTYVWSNGHAGNQLSVNNAGTYYVTATKPNGCTSSDSVTVTVWQPDTVDITVNSPDNYYVINGETFCTSGDYMQTLQNIHGCDSVINLHLTLAPRDTVFVTDTVCGGWHEIYWEDSSYDTTYIVYFDNAYDESVYSIAEYGGWGDAIVASDGLIYEFYVSGEYYRNDSLWIQYDETRTFEAVSGCDSVVKKHHYVKFSDWYGLRDTACGSYVWQGDTLMANPYYLYRSLVAEGLTNAQGCDSTVHLWLTLLPAIEETVSISACDSYTWNGVTYTESGVYTHNSDTTLQDVPACELSTLYLTINPSVTEFVEATACDSYTWNDNTYTTSGEYIQTFTSANGCDSVVTLQLTVNESKHTDITAENCGSYTWNETTYTTSGEYTQTFTSANGCDSTVTLQLTILPLPTPNITGVTTVCEGQTATLNATGGVSYLWEDGTTTNTYPATTSGLYTVTVTNAEGCSATASTTVTVNPLPEVVITGNTTICPGGSTVLTATGADSYMWSNGSTNPSIPVNMFGQYSVIGTSAAGCFSTASVTVLVSQPPVITISGNTDICAGGSTTLTANGGVNYMWSNGSTADTLVATTAGNWQVIGYNADGCSNMASVTVNLWQPASSNLYITSFDSCYLWFGTPRCESGDYTHVLQTIHGCDSVITLHLTLEDPITTEFSATGCSSYTWNSITYSQSGDYTQTFTAANGNDSIVTLHLTIKQPVVSTNTATACESYEWNGQTYTSSGDYTQTFTAANGCDSVVTLHLTVQYGTHNVETETACESYEWHSQTYTTSGTYTYEYTNADGCTSVDTLNLTVLYGTHNVETETTCESYEWHGVTYTTSGTYTYPYTNANGCASVDTLHLTIISPVASTISATACDSYEWNGETYTTSGDYEQTFTAANGCDSVVTLHLTVNPSVTEVVEVSTEDSCYTWNSIPYCTSGTYAQTLQTVHGCDSIVTLHLTITVGIDDYNLGASMTVYPNPTTGVVNVQCTMNNGQAEEVEFQLFDAFGRLLRSTDGVETRCTTSLQTDTHGSSVQTAQIDLSRFAAGVYFVKATADDNVIAVRKVVKQ